MASLRCTRSISAVSVALTWCWFSLTWQTRTAPPSPTDPTPNVQPSMRSVNRALPSFHTVVDLRALFS